MSEINWEALHGQTQRRASDLEVASREPVSPESIDMGKQMGVSSQAVERSGEKPEPKIDWEGIVRHSPRTAQFLKDNPVEEPETLSWVERQWEWSKRSLERNNAMLDSTGISNKRWRHLVGQGEEWNDDDQQEFDRYQEIMNRERAYEVGLGNIDEWWIPEVVGTAPFMAEVWAEGIKGGITGAAVGGTVGSVVPGIGTLGGASAGYTAGHIIGMIRASYHAMAPHAFNEMVDEHGVDPEIASPAAHVVALMSGVVEAGLGAEKILIPGANSLARMFSKHAVIDMLGKQTYRKAFRKIGRNLAIAGLEEGAEEGAQELIQLHANAITDALTRGVPVTIEMLADEVFTPENLARVGEGVLVGAAAGSTYGAAFSAPATARDISAARMARANQRAWEKIGKDLKDSRIGSSEAAVEAAIGNDLVYFDKAQWDLYWQSQNLDPREVADTVLGSADAYDNAAEAGHQIAIPASKYAQHIAPTPHNARLAAELRAAPEAPNARETGERMREQTAKILEVRDEIAGRLLAAGQTEAESKAAPLADFLVTMGERWGVDPMELLDRFGLDVTTESPQAIAEKVVAQLTGEQQAQEAVAEPESSAREQAQMPSEDRIIQKARDDFLHHGGTGLSRDHAHTADAIRQNLGEAAGDAYEAEVKRLADLAVQEYQARRAAERAGETPAIVRQAPIPASARVRLSERWQGNPNVQYVKTSSLAKFRSEDRRVVPKGPDNITEPTETLLPRLTEEFRSGGVLFEPLELGFDMETGHATLLDGNTRLAALQDAGIESIPVMVSRAQLHGFGRPAPATPENPAQMERVLPSDLGLEVESVVLEEGPEILAQTPLVTGVNVGKTRLANKKTGELAGFPPGIVTQADIDMLANRIFDYAQRALTNFPLSAYWYQDIGNMILRLVNNDYARADRMARILALLSANEGVTSNVHLAVSAAYQIEQGNTSPHVGHQSSEHIMTALEADEITMETPGFAEKTLAFYQNIHDAMFPDSPVNVLASTIDRHIYGAMGYVPPPSGNVGTPARNRVSQTIMRAVTQHFNAVNGTDLLPMQVQALVWTQYRDDKGLSGATFHEALAELTDHVTFEVTPAPGSAAANLYRSLTDFQKAQFRMDSLALVVDQDGRDLIAQSLGIPLAANEGGLGLWNETLMPNRVASLVALPAEVSDMQERVRRMSRDEVESYARIVQYVFRQQAVPWFRISNTLDPNDEGVVAAAVFSGVERDVLKRSGMVTFGRDFGYTEIDGKLYVVNFDNALGDTDTFLDGVQALKEELGGEVEGTYADGDYGPTIDWERDLEGQAGAERFEAALGRRPGLESWVRDRRGLYEGLLRSEGLEKAGARAALAPGRGVQQDSSARDGPTVRSDGRVELVHYSEERRDLIDPAFYGRGIPGEENRRRLNNPKDWVNRSYYGIAVDKPGGYVKEPGLGDSVNVTSVEARDLYDWDRDPADFRGAAAAAGRQGADIYTYAERLVRDSGYLGYWSRGGAAGEAAVVFQPLEVETHTPGIPYPKGLTQRERRVAHEATRVFEDYEAAKAAYAELEGTKGGTVINVDEARLLVPSYAADKSLSNAVHEPASWFTNRYFEEKVAGLTADDTVLFTAGGAAAGKTSAIRDAIGDEESVFTYDTIMGNADKAARRIDLVLKTGANVEIIYVMRDPVEAFRGTPGIDGSGALPRAMSTGRVVNVVPFVRGHIGSSRAISQINDLYADNDQVEVILIDNTRGFGNSQVAPLETIQKIDYTDLDSRVMEQLNAARKAGEISDTVYEASTPREEIADSAAVRGRAEQGAERRPPRKTVKAYKLVEVGKDGKLYPLFAGRVLDAKGRKKPLPFTVGKWEYGVLSTQAKMDLFPSAGIHGAMLPITPQLRTKAGTIAPNRVYVEMEVSADIDYDAILETTGEPRLGSAVPVGGLYHYSKYGDPWVIAGEARITRILTDDAVSRILGEAGRADEIEHETLVRPEFFEQFAPEQLLYQSAWHGSPHRFEKFSLHAIGTGEGRQAYGWGLYFASKKEVGEHYQRALGKREFIHKESGQKLSLSEIEQWARDFVGEKSDPYGYIVDNGVASFSAGRKPAAFDTNPAARKLDKHLKDTFEMQKGHLYEVNIPETEELLDYDRQPIQQSQEIQDALRPVMEHLAGVGREIFQDDGKYGYRYAPRDVIGGTVRVQSFAQYDTEQQAVEASVTRWLYQPGWKLYNALERLDGARGASEFLSEAGIPGLTYKGRTSDERNFVIWDEALIEVERLEQRDPSGPRGYTAISADRTMKIGLLENADASTFIHESGHVFLEIFSDLVREAQQATERGEAIGDNKLRMIDDMEVLLQWFGVSSIDEIGVDQKEQFARGFEAYAMEGKAPSVGLRRAFARFRAWLIGLYDDAKALNVTLNDEVRGVFDRMLATDEQIAAAQAEAEITPLFMNKPPNMSDAEWAAYQTGIADESRQARERLQQQLIREWMRENRTEWKKRLKAEIDQAIEETNWSQEYILINALKNGVLPDGREFDLKLDRATMKELTGDLRPFRGMLDDEGVHPDQIAEMVGISSTDEMIQLIRDARPQLAVAKEMGEQRMREKYPGLLQDREALAEKAMEVTLNDKQAEMVRAEMKALRAMQRAAAPAIRAMQAQQRTGRQILRDEVPTLKTFREVARGMIAAQKVRALRPGLYLTASQKASREATQALARQDFEAAAQAKRQELLNLELYKEARRVKEEVAATVKYVRKFGRKQVRQAMGKAGYLEQIMEIASRFEFANVPLRALDERQSLRDFVEAKEEAGEPISLPDNILNEAYRKNYKELRIEELREVRDSMKHLEHLARLKNRLMKIQDQRSFDAFVEALVEALNENKNKKGPTDIETELPQDRASQFFGDAFGMFRKASSIIRELDGFEDGGLAWEAFIRPANEAADREADMRAEAAKKVFEAFRPFATWSEQAKNFATRFMGMRIDDSMYTKQFIPEIDDSLTRMGRIMVGMNWGNQGNRERLMAGYGWSESQVQAILDTLTQEDWSFIESIWNVVNSYWADSKALAERLDGFAPEKVEGLTIQTKFGEVQGQYFPALYNSKLSNRAEVLDAVEKAKRAMGGASVRAQTRHGHRKGRVAKPLERPMRLDFGAIFQHLDDVIHDLTHTEMLVDLNRVLGDRRVEKAIRDGFGRVKYDQLKNIITDVAAGYVGAKNGWERFFNHLRVGSSIASMGYSFTTTSVQILGLSQSIVRVGPQWVAKGFLKWAGRDAQHMEGTVKWINSVSPFMRDRARTQLREINEIRNRVEGPHSGMRDTLFWMLTRMQMVVDIPTWLGAYEKSMASGMDEAKAVAVADQSVRDAQAGGQIIDLAAIQRGSPFMKLWTNFYSFFSTTYNMTIEQTRKRLGQGGVTGAAGWVGDIMLLYMVPAVVGYFLQEALFGNLEDKDEDDIKEELTAEIISYAMGTIPGVRELGSAVMGYHGYKGPAGARAFAELANLTTQVRQGDLDPPFWKALNRTTGVLFHLPAVQTERSFTGMMEILDGEADHPGDALRLLMFGPQ